MPTGSILSEEDDAPDLSQSPWLERLADAPVRRGRPKSDSTKVSTTIRLDADVLERFRAEGPGWQSRINEALRDWLAHR
nr:BrnA antitoxin family protein [Rhizobium sp. NFR07]